MRDGAALACAGVAGWGVAPLADHPGWSWPVLAGGLLGGAAVMSSGHRRALRHQLLERANDAVAPLLGMTPVQARGQLRADRWSQGWPGSPRRVRVRYGTGKVKLLEAAVEVGDRRWAGEVARILGARFDATYRVASNSASRGRLKLRLCAPSTGDSDKSDAPPVARAKRVVNELLGSSVKVTDIDVDEAGEVRRLAVEHEVGAKLVAPGYRRRVERTVSVMLPGRWRAHWDMEADSVLFEVRPTMPDSLWIPTLELPDSDPLENYRGVRIPYGVDEDGEVIDWRPALSPMWLVVGGTGSGKTSTMLAILTRISQYGWPVWIADGKGTSFLGYRDWPNVQVVASRIEQQVAVIHRAHELMEYRYNLVVDGLARSEDFEPLMLFVDEFTVLKGKLLTWYAGIKQKGDPAKPPTLGQIGDIARMGREGRVHMVFGLQRGDAEILTGEVRENFGQRTSLGQISPQSAEMIWNNPVTGVAIPRGKVGRAIGVNSSGLPVEMQAYRVPDLKEVAPGSPEEELIEKLRPRESRHERLLIVPPDIDWSAEEPVEPSFSDYAGAEWVKAAEHPELDPIVQQLAGPADGRALSSPLALFGLTGEPAPAVHTQTPAMSNSLRRADPVPSPGVDDPAKDTEPLEDDDGYGPSATTTPAQLRVGDLVCIDPDLGTWATVEEEPLEDFDDEDCLVVAWRDDQDDSGQLILPAEAMIAVRHPQEVG